MYLNHKKFPQQKNPPDVIGFLDSFVWNKFFTRSASQPDGREIVLIKTNECLVKGSDYFSRRNVNRGRNTFVTSTEWKHTMQPA